MDKTLQEKAFELLELSVRGFIQDLTDYVKFHDEMMKSDTHIGLDNLIGCTLNFLNISELKD